ncbi:sialate O-acetylesterase [Gemmata sp.]|uniref:sialate O-acetylesterase n=1 Tax=Gemmata sp. TaxID=1914242 RepID=UPI003F72F524
MYTSRSPRHVAILACVVLATGPTAEARADVHLPALFADHAVLQRDRPLPVWGWADPGEKVSVKLGAGAGEAVAGKDGRWQVTLESQPVSKAALTLTVAGKNTVVVRDVLLGDVWLCSGQSNMSISLGGFLAAPGVKDDVAAADYPLVRQFGVLEHFADAPQTDVTGEWLACTPRTAGRFSAVAFYFARRVHAETGVPIGILRSAKGSTRIECWLSQDTLLNTKELEPFARAMRESLAQWDRDKEAAAKGGVKQNVPGFPPYPFGEKVRRPRCVTLHNGMVAPLAPFALRGAIWYQGEGNASDPKTAQEYAVRLRSLIRDWRRLFGGDDLPFYVVQLPGYREPSDAPAGGDAWAHLRESQRRCLTLPRTGLAVTLDIGEAGDIHPRNKADVGDRLARLALADVYGKKVVPSGPLFRGLRVDGDKTVVEFDHVGAGLMVGRKDGRKPVEEVRDGTLGRFAVAGKDKKWYWADARIVGGTVVCTHPDVPNPVAVRYAFSANPAGANLYNRDGLPASPFRSDDW